MAAKSALLLGATGLTGGCLLDLLLQSDKYGTVYIYVRKPTGIVHTKLREMIIDYDTITEAVEAEDVFCCLGTTIKKAKTQEAFKKVDLIYPVSIAEIQFKAGSKRYMVVSAMGASASSSIFYSRVKGEMESQLLQIGYSCLGIFRPSFITGNRTEKRMGESMGIILFSLISPLLIGPLRKYRSVPASAIAKAMLHLANSGKTGTNILLSDQIKAFE